MTRSDGRAADQLRPVLLQSGIAPHATASVLCGFGLTRVICAATIQQGVPGWMKAQGVAGGWLTAEYSMLPYSTHDRKSRDISRGKMDGRSTEIQRLIGRSLRAVIDLKALGSRTLWVDCDVLQADGGTRTAAITGACLAVELAFARLLAEGVLKQNPLRRRLAAVSCGVVAGTPVLDLCYEEDKLASVDFNVVMTESGDFVEVQGNGEEATFSGDELTAMLGLARKGVGELCGLQLATMREVVGEPADDQVGSLASHFNQR